MMLNLVKYLKQELQAITPRIFNTNTPKNAIFPYVTLRFPTSNQLETDRDDIVVEIDIWTYAQDGLDPYVQVETLTDEIDTFLKKHRHLDENQLLIFDKINRLSLGDPDENIERRQLRYVVKTYQRNQE